MSGCQVSVFDDLNEILTLKTPLRHFIMEDSHTMRAGELFQIIFGWLRELYETSEPVGSGNRNGRKASVAASKRLGSSEEEIHRLRNFKHGGEHRITLNTVTCFP